MSIFLYFLISLIACVIGAISGIGGGIIIKPVLDAIGTYNLSTIGVLSSCTVLAMSTVSLFKNRRSTVKVNVQISLYLALGSIVGGIFGKNTFDLVRTALGSDHLAGAWQASLLIVMTISVFIYVNFKTHFPVCHVSNKVVCLGIGLLLGGVSSFLGIGGGPINIAVLAVIFAMDSKTASINSIYIIFFSQIANLLTVACTGGFGRYNLEVLPFMLVGAVLGGYLGGGLVKKMTNKDVDHFFSIVLIIIVAINCYNLYGYLQG